MKFGEKQTKCIGRGESPGRWALFAGWASDALEVFFIEQSGRKISRDDFFDSLRGACRFEWFFIK